jgi:glycosyltransferase involved in cell wall biosynthesis
VIERATARRRRVCFVVESGTDVRLVDGLAGSFDLTVLARRIEGGKEINRTPAPGVSVTVGPAAFASFARHVFRFLNEHAATFDFILVQGYGAAAMAANVAALRTGVPAAMLVCSPAEAYYRCRQGQDGFGKPYRAYELALLKAFAEVNALTGTSYIALSRYLAGVVRAHGARSVEVIPVYGVDTAVFQPSAICNRDLRRRRGLPATGAIVFFSSRIAPEKDSATLLDAFRLLRAEGRDVYLLHRSGGFARFAAEAALRGMADRVIATDAVHPHEELPFDYCVSDVCVQASRAEGLGYSVLEALACGIPVVATQVGGLRETIIDGHTGWTCPPGNPVALAAAVAAVLDDPAEGRRRAGAGRRMVTAQFERALVFRNLERFIESRAAIREVQP